MKVSEVMHNILTCDEGAKLHRVVDVMMEAERGSIIVLKEGNPIGIFTERDALRLIASNKSTKDILVREVMTKLQYIVDEDTPVIEASEIMDKHNIRRLPVTNKEGKLIGIVTAALIAKNKKFIMARSLSSGIRSESIFA